MQFKHDKKIIFLPLILKKIEVLLSCPLSEAEVIVLSKALREYEFSSCIEFLKNLPNEFPAFSAKKLRQTESYVNAIFDIGQDLLDWNQYVAKTWHGLYGSYLSNDDLLPLSCLLISDEEKRLKICEDKMLALCNLQLSNEVGYVFTNFYTALTLKISKSCLDFSPEIQHCEQEMKRLEKINIFKNLVKDYQQFIFELFSDRLKKIDPLSYNYYGSFQNKNAANFSANFIADVRYDLDHQNTLSLTDPELLSLLQMFEILEDFLISLVREKNTTHHKLIEIEAKFKHHQSSFAAFSHHHFIFNVFKPLTPLQFFPVLPLLQTKTKQFIDEFSKQLCDVNNFDKIEKPSLKLEQKNNNKSGEKETMLEKISSTVKYDLLHDANNKSVYLVNKETKQTDLTANFFYDPADAATMLSHFKYQNPQHGVDGLAKLTADMISDYLAKRRDKCKLLCFPGKNSIEFLDSDEYRSKQIDRLMLRETKTPIIDTHIPKLNIYRIQSHTLKPTDLTQIKDLLKQTYWALDADDSYIKKALDYSFFLIARDKNDHIIGLVRYADNGHFAYISDMVVDTKWRKQGVASALMQEMLQSIDSQYRFSALISAKEGDGKEAAQKLYGQKCGYVDYDQKHHHEIYFRYIRLNPAAELQPYEKITAPNIASSFFARSHVASQDEKENKGLVLGNGSKF